MRLKIDINTLQRVVKQTLDEEKSTDALRGEVSRVLGPAAIVTGRLQEVAMTANDIIDVMERTGKAGRLDFKTSVMAQFLTCNDPEVRKLATRVIPERFLSRMVNDKAPTVRAAVAARIPLVAVRSMMKKFPNDDQLRSIYRKRRLHEAGVAKPKVDDEPFDVYGEKLGDTVKQSKGPELSDAWYETKARKLIADFDNHIEHNWEILAVRQFCDYTHTTSGVDVDSKKLLKMIQDLIKEKEERVIEKDALKETLDWLNMKDEEERLDEAAMAEFTDVRDPVIELMEGNASPVRFIEGVNSLFKVQHSSLPRGIRKYRLGEGNTAEVSIPVIGYIPGNNAKALYERALDSYCSHWNSQQSARGEPLQIEWSYHPEAMNKISFSCILK